MNDSLAAAEFKGSNIFYLNYDALLKIMNSQKQSRIIIIMELMDNFIPRYVNMSNDYFKFRQFTIRQERAAFKVGTDGVLLGACTDTENVSEALDIGTGTGLIAIMIAQRSPGVRITAIEPHRESVVQAIENVKKCPWSDRITVHETDLNAFCSDLPGKFDLLVTNPPYFRNSLLNPDKAKSAARHASSLTPDEIINASLKLLNDEGSLQLILPFEEGSMFIAGAALAGLFCSRIIKVKPHPDGKIIRMIMKFERTRRPVHESFLTIETGIRHSYTDEYKNLIKDFYLKF